MSRRRKRNSHGGGAEGQERWLITYSDLITLLMIFFVIMYAMSKVNVAKFNTLEKSLQQALHKSSQIPLNDLGTTGLVVPANQQNTGDKSHTGVGGNVTPKHDKALDSLYAEVQKYITSHHLQQNVSIHNQPRGVEITLRDVVLFSTGEATIKPQARSLLKGLVPFLHSVKNPIVVEGYTDNVPIHTAQFPSNWELSSDRATNVVKFFANTGISPYRLSAVGYGQYHPVVKNNTPAHRQMNRRVNLVILREPPIQYSSSQ